MLQKEYSSENTADTFKKDRLNLLKTLLTIPRIFSTDVFSVKSESTARSNISREIEELK